MPVSHIDLLDLAKRLKQEKLFVANERKEIEGLNRKVELLSTGLFHQTWLTGQNRLALENLSLGPVSSPFIRPFVVPPIEGESDLTENLEIVEAHKHIPQKYLQSFVDLIILLRSHPDVVGLCISTYEKEKSQAVRVAGGSSVSFGDILQAVINVYGGVGGPLPCDGTLHLKLLSTLAGHQLVGSDSPRKVLRQGSIAFSTLYRLISETIPSSRLFLIGALHQPVTLLLSSQELLCLGTNAPPTSPLSVIEAASAFSNATANGDIASLDRTEKIARLTKLFIESILDHIHAFPKGLAWIITSIHSQLSATHSKKEVSLICTDLIWALFICPAVTNPEPFGVTEAPVGNEARHVLSQIATILQALALHRWEGTDPRMTEYISYFDPDSLSSILDHVLSIEGLPTEPSGLISTVCRKKVLIPENLLQPLVVWLKECLCLLEQNGKLTDIEIWPMLVKHTTSLNGYYESLPTSANIMTSTTLNNTATTSGNNVSSTNSSPSHTASNFLSNGKRSLLLRKESPRHAPSATPPNSVRDFQQNYSMSVVEFPLTTQPWEWIGMSSETEVLSAAAKNGPSGDADSLAGIDYDGAEEEEREEAGSIGEKRTRFSLSNDDGSVGKVDWDFENHVFLHCNYRDGKVVKLSGTNDNLEAVSEAASTHSVSSSIELEDQNDNLSDMLSANVSGRGTPNVSGRNTPQEDDDDDEDDDNDGNNAENQNINNDVIMNDAGGGEPANIQIEPAASNNINPPNLNNLNLNGRPSRNDGPSKQARSEIEDKFCKFEIKKLFGGDETVSLVSDTWSTDVLASDSEMGGDNHSREALQLTPASAPPQVNNGLSSGNNNSNVVPSAPNNISFLPTSSASVMEGTQNNDTMSEAWSTDVAASDIERLHDFDNDDTASVARSDDTGRSDGLEEIAYDTPRSSVSGGGPYRRPDQEPDLLLFDDVPIVPPQSLGVTINSGSNAGNPVSVQLEENGTNAMEVEISSMQITSSTDAIAADQPTAAALIPAEIIGPSSSQLNSLTSPIPLQTAGSSSSVNSRSGAIPKTISFDKTAERGDREHWDDESGRTRRSFFRNFRLPFRGRSRKPAGRHDGFDWEKDRQINDNASLLVPKLRKSLSEDVNSPASQGSNESSDEILAKYRRKPSLTDSNDGSASGAGRDGSHSSPKLVNFAGPAGGMNNNSVLSVNRKESLKITKAEIVNDARRKLRNVICNCDLQLVQANDGIPIDVMLINILRVEVASAISRADQVTAAQLQEAIRTIKQLGIDGCRKVIRLLRDDYRRRGDFLTYLMRSKQGLLSTVLFLERATVRAKHEGDTYSQYLIKECVRLWLEESKQSKFIGQFRDNFRLATVVDEKIEMLDSFLDNLIDMFVGNKELTEWQLSKVESSLEQTIVSKIYLHALYPNGEADLHRDAVLRDHISRLAAVITPSHRHLRIPKSQLGECPWPPAQRELRMLPAYKTPSDKLRCVSRAASLIVSLLSSSDKVVSADDVVPVLVFVIIKSNPPALLSTIQYVNSFCGQKNTGADQYWWTQFCSAVEFIKTMDYTD